MRKLVLAACAAVALAVACASSPPTSNRPRVIVLGIDGLDPELAQGWMREGRLPHLAALASRGGFHRLQTIPSPACEAAWWSFAVGREVAAPVVARAPARLLWNLVPVADETWSSTSKGTSFWNTAGRHGLRATVLGVPGSFPPEELPNGQLLAGLPLPDIRGTRGTYHYFATTLADADVGTTTNGGILRRLTFNRRVAHAEVSGPVHPGSGDELSAPLTLTWNHEARSVNVQLGPHAVHLRERQWSRWLELDFPVNALFRIRGIAQLFLITAGTELKLYVSPIHWHPDTPPARVSSPSAFSGELYDRLGLFRTLGWDAASAALSDERLDEGAFLDDADRAFQDRAETILNRLDANDWHLLIGVVDTADRVQHMMWRLIDVEHPRYDAELARRYAASIEQAYSQADELLGVIVSRVPVDTMIMVVSDHGFHTVRSSSKWSGDHTETDPAVIAGTLVTNASLKTTAPRLIDIGATILEHFGITPHPDMAGLPLF